MERSEINSMVSQKLMTLDGFDCKRIPIGQSIHFRLTHYYFDVFVFFVRIKYNDYITHTYECFSQLLRCVVFRVQGQNCEHTKVRNRNVFIKTLLNLISNRSTIISVIISNMSHQRQVPGVSVKLHVDPEMSERERKRAARLNTGCIKSK